MRSIYKKIHHGLGSLPHIHLPCRHYSSSVNKCPNFGFLVDIDGVLVRGSSVIEEALGAIKRLISTDGQFRVPTVFLTNSSSCDAETRAQYLSRILNVQIVHNQVVMAHSPLEWLAKDYQGKRVLVCGQGDVRHTAASVGWGRTCTIDNLRSAYPFLDVVDLRRRSRLLSMKRENKSDAIRRVSVDAVLLLREPVRWETTLQLVVDVLLTNGCPVGERQSLSDHSGENRRQHIPVIACNPDLQYMAEASTPRFGHGAFLTCLEALYSRLTGGDQLQYTHMVGKPYGITYEYAISALNDMSQEIANRCGVEKTSLRSIYCIGDNLSADILGANLYDRQLQSRQYYRSKENRQRCVSVHVQTGVDCDPVSSAAHVPRDLMPVDETLFSPERAFKNVLDAVDEILSDENFN